MPRAVLRRRALKREVDMLERRIQDLRRGGSGAAEAGGGGGGGALSGTAGAAAEGGELALGIQQASR